MDVGPMELVLILGIVMLLFGAGKVADLGGALGRSVREFRQAVHGDDDSEPVAGPPAPMMYVAETSQVLSAPSADTPPVAPPLRDFVPSGPTP